MAGYPGRVPSLGTPPLHATRYTYEHRPPSTAVKRGPPAREGMPRDDLNLGYHLGLVQSMLNLGLVSDSTSFNIQNINQG